MSKSPNDHQNNQRIGDLAEALTQTFLLEYVDFCFPTQNHHPADLFFELNNQVYRVQVKARNRTPEGKYVFVQEAARTKSEIYKNYHCDLLAFVFMPDKRILFLANTSQQQYFTFTTDIIADNMELDSLESALNKLHSIPVLNPVLK
jgi:hypothetical protein